MTTYTAAYPAHTRTWLAYIDAAVTERVVSKHGRVLVGAKEMEANELLSHATGETAYFARLYIAQLAAHGDRMAVRS